MVPFDFRKYFNILWETHLFLFLIENKNGQNMYSNLKKKNITDPFKQGNMR